MVTGHKLTGSEDNFVDLMFGPHVPSGDSWLEDYFAHLARVVQKVDNAIHRTNHYPLDGVVCFVNIYLLDSDLSGG